MDWMSRTSVPTAKAQPDCFGKHWDGTNTECAGGNDPAYRHPDTGSHTRERCVFFESCGARVQAAKNNMVQNVVPAPQLTRFQPRPTNNPQPLGGQPTQIQPQAMVPTAPQYNAQQINQQIVQQVLAAIRQGTPQAAPNAQLGYQQMMPVNFHVPQYLSVREERGPEDSLIGLLGRELVRSMGKSVGHTLANFFDMTPLRGPR